MTRSGLSAGREAPSTAALQQALEAALATPPGSTPANAAATANAAAAASTAAGRTAAGRTAAGRTAAGRTAARAAPALVTLHRRPSPYRTSYALEEVDVELADGSTLRLMFKDLGPDSLLEPSRRVKPRFLASPLREIETYRTLLAPRGFGPHYHGSVVDPHEQRYWLFIERVDGLELFQVGSFDVWLDVARWLARFHAVFADAAAVEAAGSGARLIRYDEAFLHRWLARAQTFHAQVHGASPRVDEALGRLAARYDDVVRAIVGMPVTLLHGEFYASNILVRLDAAGPARVVPVDWEMAAVGPGLVDLAALVAGRWSDDARSAIADAYRTTYEAIGGAPWSSIAGFRRSLDVCRLHVAVQWMGWAADWGPPAEHRHDWAGEALTLAGRLALL